MAVRDIIILPDKRLRLVSEPVKSVDAELRALVEFLEPLPDTVTDIMLDLPPALEDKIRAAQEQIQQILERVRSA